MQSVSRSRPFRWRGMLLLLTALFVALGSLTVTSSAFAQSGGGFGGSSSRSSGSSSSSSSSGGGYSGGGYSGGGYSGGGYTGGYGPVIINNGGYGPGYGGGYYTSGGSSGLIGLLIFGFLVFMAISFMRRSLGSGGVRSLGSGNLGTLSGTAQAVSVQLLLAEGDEVKSALQDIARNGDPDTNQGLTRMLQEAALVALRHPERWVYGNVERAQGAPSAADSQVGAWATEARAAFTDQTTSNYQNRDPHSGYKNRTDYTFQKDTADQYLAVTIAAAAHAMGTLPPAGVTTAAETRAALSTISAITAEDLIRAEVIWSPDVEGEFLSEDEAIQKYPKLTKL